jgi:hypothetical protein
VDESQLHGYSRRGDARDCSTLGTVLASLIARRGPFLYNCHHGLHAGC